MSEMLKGRIELRCTEADRSAFRAAARRDGFSTMSAWLTVLGRIAARTAADTLRSVNVRTVVVKP
jgi:hypothetical protein